MTNKDKHVEAGDGKSVSSSSERYTIFHALFEALKEKDRKLEKK